jgi:hypothetical protein
MGDNTSTTLKSHEPCSRIGAVKPRPAMTKAQEHIDLMLNEIEEKCVASDYDQCRVPFMLDCVSLTQGRMPSLAVKALETARAYSVHESPLDSVREAIEGCWRYLDQGSVHGSIDDRETCAIRALICLLREQSQPGSEDLVDLMSFFLNLLNRVEPHADEQILLIKKHFQHCLDR